MVQRDRSRNKDTLADGCFRSISMRFRGLLVAFLPQKLGFQAPLRSFKTVVRVRSQVGVATIVVVVHSSAVPSSKRSDAAAGLLTDRMP